MAEYPEKQLTMKNGDSFTIRSARREDAQLVLDYVHSILRDSPYIYVSENDFQVTLTEEAEFLEQLQYSSMGIMLLAICNNKVIGNIDLRPSRYQRIAHRASFGMSTLSQYRGQGVGRALLQSLIQFIQEKQLIEKLELGVIEENDKAIRLYQSVGFKEEGRSLKGFRTDQGKYLDEIHMGLWVKNF